MGLAFEITAEDVDAALVRLGVPSDLGLAERWLDEIDTESAEDAALGFSGDLDEQTEAAIQDVVSQLRAFGVPSRSLDGILAERQRQDLDRSMPSAPTTAPRSPRF